MIFHCISQWISVKHLCNHFEDEEASHHDPQFQPLTNLLPLFYLLHH